MDDRKEKLFDIFKQAVEDERKAQQMYGEAIALCRDPELIRILEKLRRDEANHEKSLVEQYNRLKEGMEP
jgi:rubrerythrin